MLNASELKILFEKKYERAQWYRVLRENFNVTKTIHEKAVDITQRIKSNDYNATALELGNFNTTDGHLVGIYEVEVPDKVLIHRNRKGLRDLLSQVYSNDVEAALLVFIQGNKWRFSYVIEITKKNKITNKRETKTTDPKRFTYLMGEGERCKTASDRFAGIKKSHDLFGGGITLDALEEAFNVDKMSKAFFNEYRKQYGYFTAQLTGEDENGTKVKNASPFLQTTFNGDHKAARDFVKKLLGRIVFLYFLEKKGWLGVDADKVWGEGDENFLSNLFNHSKDKRYFYSNVLVPLFFYTLNTERKYDHFKIDASHFSKPGYDKLRIPYLNGGLFEEDETKTQFLVFPEILFTNLFKFFDQYNFTVYEDSPDEHTVAVDPEMLGHIFENLLEDNKDKGAYYTPKEIVHYMCRESLIGYLYTKLNSTSANNLKEIIKREAIEKFVLLHEAGDIIEYEEEILLSLREVKICDPAIGSGAFPMGLLMEIYYLVETMFDISKDVVNRIWKLGTSDIFNAAKVKEQIIQNSIYGVDIEQGAVDIARLRFWLSLVVDEDIPKSLPNLDYKIVTGNSLLSKFNEQVIDIDWNIKTKNASGVANIINDLQKKLLLLETRQHLYFIAKGNKGKLQREIQDLKIDVLVNQITLNRIGFEENNTSQLSLHPTDKEKQKVDIVKETIRDFNRTIHKLEAIKKHKTEGLDFLDWKLVFPEVMNEKVTSKEVGFDIVIGNPPYVNFREIKSMEEKNAYLKRYVTAEYQSDLYILFVEKAYSILNKGGQFAFIIPNSITNNLNNGKIRKFILDHSSIKSITNTPMGVFEYATVDTVIICSSKALGNGLINCLELKDGSFNLVGNKIQNEFIANLNYNFDFLVSNENKIIINKIETDCVLLDEITDSSSGIKEYETGKGVPPQTEKDRITKKFNSNEKLNSHYWKHLTGSEIDNYIISWKDSFLKYGKWLAAPRDWKIR